MDVDNGTTGRPTNVASVLLERSGEVLFVQEGKSGVAGTWNLPGGHIEAGETPMDTARREAHEEAGVTVSIQGLVGIYLGYDQAAAEQVYNHVFAATTDNTVSISVEADSIQAAGWFDVETDVDLRDQSIRRALSDYMANVQYDINLYVNVLGNLDHTSDI